jgi:hypothetical protein
MEAASSLSRGRRRLQGLQPFVVTRGGECCFIPGLRAMRWLAKLDM